MPDYGLEPLTAPHRFPFGTWDVEASEWWNLEMIGVYDGDSYCHFRGIEEFLTYILQKRYRNYRWFAHFGGRYDMNFIFDYLRDKQDVDVSFYCSGSIVIQMTIRYHGMTAKLCDSYRLFGVRDDTVKAEDRIEASLRALGKAFGVMHQKQTIDFEEIHYGRQLIEYNEMDCRCLYEVIERFFEETGVHSETFATHALRVFRKDFLKQTLYPVRPEISEFIRQGYHGGRVEVYKRGADDLIAYDVNSMYPFVMLRPQPVEYLGESRQLVDDHFGFLDCDISVPEMYVPPLPVMREKLYFPTGKWRGVWSSVELIEAEKRGVTIDKVHQGYYFRAIEIFKSYIEKLYAIKKKATEPARTIAKLLMNSLYGKFGQNPVKRVYMTERTAPDGATVVLNPDGKPSGFCYIERTSRSAYLLPHLASAVTSRARMVLLHRMGEHVFYCDTDSVFTNVAMVTGKDLGEWSEVGRGAARFIQPKLYEFNGKWKSKGLDKEQSIADFVAGNPHTLKRAISIKEALNAGVTARQHRIIVKQLRESRPKREWIGDDTRPWDIREI